mgnify:FL=1
MISSIDFVGFISPAYILVVMDEGGLQIHIVGAGGIGSNLIALLLPSLRNGIIANQLGGISFHLHDADMVEEKNLVHQRFTESHINMPKVDALAMEFNLIHPNVRVIGHSTNLRSSEPLRNANIIIVAVDRPEPRRIVHSLRNVEWYDLRCGLDSCLVLTHETHPDDIERLTPEHKPASCQPDGAIESGNIQFGSALAGTFGANIILRSLMNRIGNKTNIPGPVCFSMDMGMIPVFIQTKNTVPFSQQPPKRPTHLWSEKEDVQLLEQAKRGLTLERVASHHQRSPGAIWHRLLKITGIRKTLDSEVGE